MAEDHLGDSGPSSKSTESVKPSQIDIAKYTTKDPEKINANTEQEIERALFTGTLDEIHANKIEEVYITNITGSEFGDVQPGQTEKATEETEEHLLIRSARYVKNLVVEHWLAILFGSNVAWVVVIVI